MHVRRSTRVIGHRFCRNRTASLMLYARSKNSFCSAFVPKTVGISVSVQGVDLSTTYNQDVFRVSHPDGSSACGYSQGVDICASKSIGFNNEYAGASAEVSATLGAHQAHTQERDAGLIWSKAAETDKASVGVGLECGVNAHVNAGDHSAEASWSAGWEFDIVSHTASTQVETGLFMNKTTEVTEDTFCGFVTDSVVEETVTPSAYVLGGTGGMLLETMKQLWNEDKMDVRKIAIKGSAGFAATALKTVFMGCVMLL